MARPSKRFAETLQGLAETLETIETHNSVANPARLPHTAWARPYARGTTRALFVIAEASYTNALVLRRVADLMQRFDITGETVAVSLKGEEWTVKEAEMEIMGKPEAITEVSTTAYDRCVFHWAAFFTFCLIGDR